MARSNALAALVKSGVASQDDGRERPEETQLPALAPSAPADPAPKAATTREGKKFLSIYVDPAYHKRLKLAAVAKDLQVQEVLKQALDAWMEANGA